MFTYFLFLIIVLIHFCEHLAQVYQLYFLNWPRLDCLGLIGLKYPLLIQNELLHYFFAIYMLVGMNYFYYKVTNKFWWNVGIGIQTYHYLEHVILLNQWLNKIPLKDRISIGSFLLPRLELHFVYNLIVSLCMLLSIFAFKKKTNVFRKNL